MEEQHNIQTPFLNSAQDYKGKKRWRTTLWFFISMAALLFIYLTIGSNSSQLALSGWEGLIKRTHNENNKVHSSDAIESFEAVVAADDARCSEIGASVLRAGGHAVDAAVSVALCGGVVNPMASGIGGGGFMVVRSADTSQTQAFDFRETAPSAASQNMYQNNLDDKYSGALAMGVPGEIAGLYKAWLQHGRMPWKTLFQPAISLAKDGFTVAPYLASSLSSSAATIKKDPGLQKVYAPNGNILQAGETCYNYELGLSLEAIAEEGPEAFYNGTIGEKLIKDVRSAGGILTMEDLRKYNVKVTDAVEVNTMGFRIFGMPPPSSGTLGLALVLNILNSYENTTDAKGLLGQEVTRFKSTKRERTKIDKGLTNGKNSTGVGKATREVNPNARVLHLADID
nr:gamma-glutamyltranspeptidase 3-like isoform X1 [Tanacetum cinerariifolium]